MIYAFRLNYPQKTVTSELRFITLMSFYKSFQISIKGCSDFSFDSVYFSRNFDLHP